MEDYVTYEQAVKLKELGFDWECLGYFLYDDNVEIGKRSQNYNTDWSLINLGYIAAPTLSQAQKWLREKGLIINITYEPVYYYGDIYNISKNDYEYIITENFETYESVLSIMIDKALEILKQN